MGDAQRTPWFENAVIYQIPVALFQDTDGNGWGDLQGVRRHTDVAIPEEPQEDWEEAIADHAYDDSPKESTLHLHGFGYRWLVR